MKQQPHEPIEDIMQQPRRYTYSYMEGQTRVSGTVFATSAKDARHKAGIYSILNTSLSHRKQYDPRIRVKEIITGENWESEHRTRNLMLVCLFFFLLMAGIVYGVFQLLNHITK